MANTFTLAARYLTLLLLLFHHASTFQPSSQLTLGSIPSVGSCGTASFSPLFRRPSATCSVPSFVDVGMSSAVIEDIPTTSTEPEMWDGDGGPQLGAWIPIASASALTGIGPQKIRVMGLDLVVWHKPVEPPSSNDEGDGSVKKSGNGITGKFTRRKELKAASESATEWSVHHDICPHRLAPLSQGRVDPVTGCIECPYHGWQFDTDGTLVSLPQLEDNRSIEAVRGRGGNAKSFPVHLAGDLIFAFLPTSVHGESFPRILLPEEQYPYLADAVKAGNRYFVRELPYSADFLIENFMDPAHIPFAHHKLQSVRDDGTAIEMKVMANNFTHVEVGFKDLSRGKARDGVLSFQRPSMYHFRTRKDGGDIVPNLCIFITPVEGGRSRVLFSGLSVWWLPTWLEHAASNRFLNTDTWLHDAERVARSKKYSGKENTDDLDYVYGSRSDLGVSIFRKWWAKHGFRDSPRNTFGPADASDLSPRALTRREQVDPWESHSKHCSECRAALKVIKRGQIAGLIGAALSAVFLRGRPLTAVAAIVLGICTNVFLKKCATVIEGNPYPSGIDDRSPAAGAE